MQLFKSFIGRTIIIFAIIGMANSPAPAQQLIANGSFENYTSCPTSLSQVSKAIGWRWPTTGSSDYYGCSFTSISAIAGQPSHGTMVMAGYAYSGFSSCTNNLYSEMLMTPLTATLIAGRSYKVQFDLQLDGVGTLTKMPNHCADFGFWFHDSTNATYPANQYCALDTIIPTWAVRFDSLNGKGNYRTFVFTFIAKGGENRVIIGPWTNANTPTCTTNDLMYYNVDNISMEDHCQITTESDDTICHGERAELRAHGPNPLWWSTEIAPNDTIEEDSVLFVSPDTSMTFIVHDSMCELPMSVHVDTVPKVELGADTFICSGDIIYIKSRNPYALLDLLWSDGSNGDSLQITSGGNYSVIVNDSNCINYDTIDIAETILVVDDQFIDIDVVNCDHQGSIKAVEALGGKSPYEYFWLNENKDTVSYDKSLSKAPKGKYHFYAKDADGCDIISPNANDPGYEIDSMPKIHLEVLKGDTQVYLGDFAQLLVTGAPFYEWTPETGLTCTDCPDPEAGPETTTTYTVRGWDPETGCDDSLNITVDIEARHIAEVPDLFSPNGDGINDYYLVYFINLEDINFEIYNRWGEMVFQTNAQDEFWDGTYKGKEQPMGTYIFRLTAKSKITGEDIHQYGTIGLLR